MKKNIFKHLPGDYLSMFIDGLNHGDFVLNTPVFRDEYKNVLPNFFVYLLALADCSDPSISLPANPFVKNSTDYKCISVSSYQMLFPELSKSVANYEFKIGKELFVDGINYCEIDPGAFSDIIPPNARLYRSDRVFLSYKIPFKDSVISCDHADIFLKQICVQDKTYLSFPQDLFCLKKDLEKSFK